jgi:hypothetical protein
MSTGAWGRHPDTLRQDVGRVVPIEYSTLRRLTPDGRARLDATIAYLGGTDCTP